MKMNKYDIWEDYKLWLLEKVGFHKPNYKKLSTQLQDFPFESILRDDKNRIKDGMDLRKEFLAEKKLNPHSLDYYDKCSVLELLVALAIRINDEYIGDPVNPEPPFVLFWEMLKNLNIDWCNDSKYNTPNVINILQKWTSRRFQYNGEESIFPLRNPKTDQRECSIWNQMQAYISENYIPEDPMY